MIGPFQVCWYRLLGRRVWKRESHLETAAMIQVLSGRVQ